MFPEIVDEVHSAPVRHGQVADYGADCACQHWLVQKLLRAVAVLGEPDLIALSAQREAGGFSNVVIVVDYQDCAVHRFVSLFDARQTVDLVCLV